MARNINRVTITGNLTADPVLRNTQSGTAVCSLRLAVNDSVKRDGEWTERASFFDVTVWGRQGESCATHLSKGRPVAIDGRLEWQQWQAVDGSNRSTVKIVADHVQFLGGQQNTQSAADTVADEFDATEVGGDGDDSDIPF